MIIIFLLLLLVNFIISWYNASSVGKVWVEAKVIGGFTYFMTLMGAVMSAIGFTWVYVTVLALLLGALGKISSDAVQGILSLGYLLIIIPLLGSGLAIMVSSLITAWKQRTFGNVAVAGYNTIAQAYNSYSAIQTIPSALSTVVNLFGGKKSKNTTTLVVILVVIGAIFGGILTTYAIIASTIKKQAKLISSSTLP